MAGSLTLYPEGTYRQDGPVRTRLDITPAEAVEAKRRHRTLTRAAAVLSYSETFLARRLREAGEHVGRPGSAGTTPNAEAVMRRDARGRFVALLAVAFVAALWQPLPQARAHGDASWIMADPQTSWCCGPKDCGPVPAEDVTWTPAGWVYRPTGETFPETAARLHRSADEHFWRCRYMAGPLAGKTRCLFVPGAGS